jgi:peptidoglycan/xylan/chitin deacetylase (PgdA/CDA1 family)
MPAMEKEIYLTFDDGPIPGPTEFVLDQLEKANAKATFFCIGDNVSKHPSIFQKVAGNGHRIANHTFSHLNGWSCNDREYVENIRHCREEFAKNGVGRDDVGLFRPPYGRIKRSQIKLLNEYTIVMWDVLTLDYAPNISAERCLRGSVNATRPGSIIVFHDSLKAEKNVTYALPRFLDHFASRGYSFKTLTNS